LYNALQACQPHNQSTRQKLTYHQPKSTNQLTNLTTRSRVLSEKLTVPQLVRNLPTFNGTRRFIITFTCHVSLSSPKSIQSMPCHPTSSNSILKLSSHLCLVFPNGLFPPGLSSKIMHASLLSPIHATCPAQFQGLVECFIRM